jgi:hypothetical protein
MVNRITILISDNFDEIVFSIAARGGSSADSSFLRQRGKKVRKGNVRASVYKVGRALGEVASSGYGRASSRIALLTGRLG